MSETKKPDETTNPIDAIQTTSKGASKESKIIVEFAEGGKDGGVVNVYWGGQGAKLNSTGGGKINMNADAKEKLESLRTAYNDVTATTTTPPTTPPTDTGGGRRKKRSLTHKRHNQKKRARKSMRH